MGARGRKFRQPGQAKSSSKRRRGKNAGLTDNRTMTGRGRIVATMPSRRSNASPLQKAMAWLPAWLTSKALLRGAALPLALFVIWETASRLARVKFDYLSSPMAILGAGVRALANGSVLLSTWQTFEAAIVGLLLAVAIGVAIGALIGLSRFAEVTALPTIEGLRAVPSVAFIPLALLLFGYGLPMEGSIVFYACIWPVLISTIDGVRGVEPRLLEVGRALEFNFAESVWKIVLPAALPRILVGVKIAAGFALVVAVTVEIVVNPRGLGYALVVAQQMLDVDLMYAQLLWLGLLGVALNALIERLSRGVPGSAGGRPA